VTLNGLRESYPEKRIIAAFEPRSNTSRRSYFQEAYGSSFKSANIVFILEVVDAGGYSGTDSEIVALDVEKVIRDISAHGTEAHSVADVSQLQIQLLGTVCAGDLVVLMSNGDFGGLPQSFVDALEKNTR
jgi:UDP-N-acetylmuramate: L-alanyl-gamma-D-glutamyl-meso-diaminopimelate ligase